MMPFSTRLERPMVNSSAAAHPGIQTAYSSRFLIIDFWGIQNLSYYIQAGTKPPRSTHAKNFREHQDADGRRPVSLAAGNDGGLG